MGSTESESVLGILFTEIGKVDEDKRKMELLSSLRTAMGNLSRAQLMEQMDSLNLEILFACLVSENSEQINSTCEILKNLMTVLDPVACFKKYHEAIAEGFSHPFPEVPALIIAHLTRCIEADESSLDSFPQVRVAVIQQLASEELAAAKEADKFLVKYGTTDAGKLFLLSDQCVETYKGLMSAKELNDSKLFRVYESVTGVATLSPEHLQKLDRTVGLMDLMIKLSFHNEDILGQMNALEILAGLVGCAHGQEALKSAGVFQEIKKIVDNLEGIPHGEILLPSILKFIGKIGAITLPPLEMVTLVVQSLINSERDFAIKVVAAESLAYIGSTLEGKRALKQRSDIRKCFQTIRELIFEGSTQYRSRGLDAMAHLFGSDEANEDCLPHWFNVLFRDMSELFQMIRLPFPELRISGLTFLSSIAHLEWAQRHYLRGPGVIEFLISREPEPVKECVYAKFRLVNIIIDSPTAATILSPENMAQLKLYVHQGPFYAQAEATVATAGAGP